MRVAEKRGPAQVLGSALRLMDGRKSHRVGSKYKQVLGGDVSQLR